MFVNLEGLRNLNKKYFFNKKKFYKIKVIDYDL